MCTSKCVRVCVCVSVHVHVCMCTCICVYVCVKCTCTLCVHMCMCTCVYVHVCVCTCKGGYVYMCVRGMFTYVCTCTVQLTFKLTLVCSERACVLQFLLCQESKHACDMKWAACKSTFVYCTQLFFMRCTRVIICVMHNSKKHTSNTSCAARESVSLCVACKLTAVFCQKRIKAYNEKAPQQNVIKRVDT